MLLNLFHCVLGHSVSGGEQDLGNRVMSVIECSQGMERGQGVDGANSGRDALRQDWPAGQPHLVPMYVT